MKIEPSGEYIDNSNPLVQEDIEYSIVGFSKTTVMLRKSKQVSKYNDGRPDKSEVFK